MTVYSLHICSLRDEVMAILQELWQTGNQDLHQPLWSQIPVFMLPVGPDRTQTALLLSTVLNVLAGLRLIDRRCDRGRGPQSHCRFSTAL